MKLLPVLTLVCAVATAGVVVWGNNESETSIAAVRAPAADPVDIDSFEILAKPEDAAPAVELERSPFSDFAPRNSRWQELKSIARNYRPKAPSARRQVVQASQKSTRGVQQHRADSRIDRRSSRRRSIFQTSRSYRANGSALERQHRRSRRGRSRSHFRFSRPFRSSIDRRLSSPR